MNVAQLYILYCNKLNYNYLHFIIFYLFIFNEVIYK